MEWVNLGEPMAWLPWNKPLTPKQRAIIEKMVSRGKGRFIWFGTLGWAVPVVLLITAWDYYDPARAQKPFETNVLIFSVRLAIWLVGGYVVGAGMWTRCRQMLDRQR